MAKLSSISMTRLKYENGKVEQLAKVRLYKNTWNVWLSQLWAHFNPSNSTPIED